MRPLPLVLVANSHWQPALFTVIAKCGLLAASSYYVATSFPFLAAMYYYLQQGYLRTSRQLRFLDLEEKAPLYTQFLETLAGLSTIRAFGWSDAAVAENHELVNRSQRPFFMLIMVQRWLEVVMELSTTALALLVVGFSVYLRDSVSVSMTGVSLVQLISMSEALSLLIQFWVQLETSLGAVARIGQFADETPQEDDPDEKAEPPLAWPSKGHVVIDNIRASYGDSGEVTAVDGVSLDIQPGEKIGICGRTGRRVFPLRGSICHSPILTAASPSAASQASSSRFSAFWTCRRAALPLTRSRWTLCPERPSADASSPSARTSSCSQEPFAKT